MLVNLPDGAKLIEECSYIDAFVPEDLLAKTAQSMFLQHFKTAIGTMLVSEEDFVQTMLENSGDFCLKPVEFVFSSTHTKKTQKREKGSSVL